MAVNLPFQSYLISRRILLVVIVIIYCAMNFFAVFSLLSLVLSLPLDISSGVVALQNQTVYKIAPKVFAITLFEFEEIGWVINYDFVYNFTLPGLSPLYPQVQCIADFELCHITLGEGEINAASSTMALLLNPMFDFTDTFWIINGIGGGNPKEISFGSVAFAKYAVQVGLQYDVDSRELVNTPYANWTTGYWGFDTDSPLDYPESVYGSEVFELNENLRDKALKVAKKLEATLDPGDNLSVTIRNQYPSPGNSKPVIKACDVVTSDPFFIGKTLDKYFFDYTKLITNGTATYCVTVQEDNAILEAFVRIAKANLVRFDRILLLRGVSDYSEPPVGIDPVTWFNTVTNTGAEASLINLFHVANAVAEDILSDYDTYISLTPDNYVGDILGTLGGEMDFGSPKFLIANQFEL